MSLPEPVDPIEIRTRPYLHDLLAPEPARPASGAAHLYAAVTGQPFTENPGSAGTDLPTPVPAVFVTSPILNLPSAPPTPSRGRGREQAVAVGVRVDRRLVVRLVRELNRDTPTMRSRADFDIADASPFPETGEEQEAWTQIEELINRHATERVLRSGEDNEWTPHERAAHVQAIFDEAFRCGPLSALLREDVENIDILGADRVWVTLPDGARQLRPPIADTDEEVEELIAKIATDRGRVFARPHGTVRLDLGGARFTAIGGPAILPRPRIALRKHRLVDIDLPGMVRYGTLTARMGELLQASMRASLSHLISGFPGTGKTTFLRALASALPPTEPIVTIETERELYLDKLTSRHLIVDPLQYLPNATSGDDRTAAFSLDTGIEYALRLNAQVILFGEILGPAEAASAIKALQAGKGASSTIHASSAFDAIQRLSTALTQAGGLSDEAVPQRQILHSLDLIIQLDLLPATDEHPHRRIVTELGEVIPGDSSAGRDQRPIVKPIFRWNSHTLQHDLIEEPTPHLLNRLIRAGLRKDFFQERHA